MQISPSTHENHPDTAARRVILTFDVEDWFQVENFKPWISYESWPRRESRVERATKSILDLLDRCGDRGSMGHDGPGSLPPIRATFFILGWTAAAFPSLVREISDRGHEVASHGCDHQMVTHQSPKKFYQDLVRSKKVLEDITGSRVEGYRAPSFSITESSLHLIAEAGYRYDSSYNSAGVNPRYGRMPSLEHMPSYPAIRLQNGLFEIPVSNLRIDGLPLPWGGGGYFRLIPFSVFRYGVERILEKDGAYVFYAHPWEFDPGQPRVKEASPLARFRHYFHLKETAGRLERLVAAFSGCQFQSIRQLLPARLSSATGAVRGRLTPRPEAHEAPFSRSHQSRLETKDPMEVRA
ncbi:MAG: XrtA system polysaccharide deacetylase [Desulfobacterales bacterium]